MLVIVAKSILAEGIWRFELAAPNGEPSPAYSAGAHIAVRDSRGPARTYSLNEAGERRPGRYATAVARGTEGGVSARLVDDSEVGDVVSVSAPRDTFGLADTTDHLLIAGGIGITPIRSMLHELERDRPADRVRLIYLSRSQPEAAYLAE
jgi:phthalate 4,5-dioxygenase reductase subunit